MSSKTIKAAIEGSIANPKAAKAVIAAVDAAADQGALAELNAAAAVANIATADATDLASAVALSNANKAKINALLASLRAAGILAT